MPHFVFQGLTTAGDAEIGSVEAADTAEARQRLQQRGLLPVELRPRPAALLHRKALSARDLALGLRILADLLGAGLPLQRALSSFESLAPDAWKPAMSALREGIREGQGMASVLSSLPIAIPPIVVGMARAGEAGAGLTAAMRRAADLTETTARTDAAIRSALAYPIVLAIAGAASIGVMVGVVLPRFAAILGDLGQQLPPSTRAVMQTAHWFRVGFIPGLVAVGIGAVSLRAWRATAAGRQILDGLLLRTPLIGIIREASATARSAATLGALLGSGIPLRTAMPFAADAAGDAVVALRWVAAREQVIAGRALGASIAEHRAMTPIACRLAKAGEDNGDLEGMLLHAARLEQERADRLTTTAVKFLEPMLILCFAGIVGVVAAALLQAVYSVRPS